MSNNLYIVDSQIHIWDVDHPEAIPRHGDKPFRLGDALAEMDAAGVDRAVIVPPYWVQFDNSYALSAAQKHPHRFGVMSRFDITNSTNPDRLIKEFKTTGMLGFRLLFNTPIMHPFLCGTLGDWFWSAAADAKIPVMLHAPGMLDGVKRVASLFPTLTLAIDHMGVGRAVRDDAAFTHLPELLEISKLPNVSIKLSTLPIFSSDPYPYVNLHPYLKQLFDSYGPERLFWGSDLSRLPCSYRVCINLFLNELPWLSRQDIKGIMGQSLCSWLDWPASKPLNSSLIL